MQRSASTPAKEAPAVLATDGQFNDLNEEVKNLRDIGTPGGAAKKTPMRVKGGSCAWDGSFTRRASTSLPSRTSAQSATR